MKLFLSDEMYKKYGNIVRFDTGFGKTIYVLNDFYQVNVKNDNSNTSKSKILCKSNNPQAKSLFSMDSLSSRPAEYFQKYIKGPFHK